MRTKALLVLLGMIVAGTATAPRPVTAQTLPAPNFVVIVTDDQRADTLEIMEKTRSRFASQGTEFTNSFATTPLCCPARASIFTGRYAHNHRVRTNRGAEDLDQETTIQYHLKNSGYRTAIFGKFLNEWKGDPPYFDRWALPETRHYRQANWNVNGEETFVHDYSTLFLGDQALGFVSETESLDAQPWLMFITPQAAHRPYTTEIQYIGHQVPEWEPSPAVNEQDVSDKPPYIRRKDRIEIRAAERTRRRQLRTLLSVDDLVEEIFAGLESSNELDHTYVFFLSDNGFAWGDHRLFGAGALKNTPYTSSIRVPLLMYGPTLSPGGVDDRLVANIDVAPTIIDLADVPTLDSSSMDGRSLVGDWSRDWLLLEWWRARKRTGIPPWRSLRSATAQYTEYRRKGRVVAREFYDLVADPFQLLNVLGDEPKGNDPDVGQLRNQLRAFARCSGNSCP